ncbi:MAG: zinc ribbon domain-containing protein [Myxococcota bacterium]|nr:zinc ribbon domain-containing protein [Myxococcota bacterium]
MNRSYSTDMTETCPSCHQDTQEGQLFCPHCGYALCPPLQRHQIQAQRAEQQSRWSDAVHSWQAALAEISDPSETAMVHAQVARLFLTRVDDAKAAIEHLSAADAADTDHDEWFKTLDESLIAQQAHEARFAVHRYRVRSADISNVVERTYQFIAVAQSLRSAFHPILQETVDRFPTVVALRKELAMSAEQSGDHVQAEAIYRDLLEANSLDVDALRGLRRVYLGKQNYDAAWCLCRALCELERANRDEEMFFNQYATQSPTRASNPLHNAHWSLVDHPFLDGPINDLFETAYEALVRCLGLKPKSLAIKPKRDGVSLTEADDLVRIIAYLFEAMPIPSMTVYRSDRTALLRPVLTQPPSLLIAREGLHHADSFTTIFRCARRLARSRPSQLIAGTYSDHAERFKSVQLLLQTLLVFAGHQSSETQRYDKRLLSGLQKTIKGHVQTQVVQFANQIVEERADIKQWLAGVELTADRVGFILANHLQAAIREIENQSEGIYLLSAQDRIASLRSFAVSENYIQVRRIIGHHID